MGAGDVSGSTEHTSLKQKMYVPKSPSSILRMSGRSRLSVGGIFTRRLSSISLSSRANWVKP